MRFSWDADKAKTNLAKHGVSFTEAATVFADPLAQIFPDVLHSIAEEREVIVGYSRRGRLLVVPFTERADGRVRLISARPATPAERQRYEEILE